jgi:CBS domain-containing protein
LLARCAIKVADIVTREPRCCSPDDDVRDVGHVMADNQVRRVPIVDGDGCCVGIVSQADLARAALDAKSISEREIAIVVERISEPRRRPFDHGGRDTAREQRF